jgi:hypothetical protein
MKINPLAWGLALMVASVLALVMALPALAQHVHGQADKAGSASKRRPPPLAIGAAFSPAGELWVVALNEQQRLTLQTSADNGRSWGPARVLDTGSDKIAADGENRPKLVFGPAGRAVITYTQPLAKPYTGNIRMLRSQDEGRTFSAPFTVHQDRQLITHRFESVAFDARGTLHTVWVDKRDLELLLKAVPVEAVASGARPARPKVDYRGAAIYRNESTDGGQTFGPDIKVADYSCECCRIALAPSPDGSLVALWRHVFLPNQRDHAFASLASVKTPDPVRATFDRWAIDACPHHGPGLAPSAAGGYHAVWYGERGGEGRVRYGRLAANGSPVGDAQNVPDDRAEHAFVQSSGSRVAIVWRSFDGQATRWRAWLSKDDGRSFALQELGRSADDNDHPLLTLKGSDIYAVWRTVKGVQVEHLLP